MDYRKAIVSGIVAVSCLYPLKYKNNLTPMFIDGIIINDNSDDLWLVDFSKSLKNLPHDNIQEVMLINSNDCNIKE